MLVCFVDHWPTQIFNWFASQQEEETGPVAGMGGDEDDEDGKAEGKRDGPPSTPTKAAGAQPRSSPARSLSPQSMRDGGKTIDITDAPTPRNFWEGVLDSRSPNRGSAQRSANGGYSVNVGDFSVN